VYTAYTRIAGSNPALSAIVVRRGRSLMVFSSSSIHNLSASLPANLKSLQTRGVVIVDPRQTYLDESVDLTRICAGAVLHPGTRLCGPRTFIGPGAKVGTEGPAMLDDAVLGENVEIASGYLKEAVLLRGARAGANAHIRSGTLLEEEASTAHAVGLKHTILMSFVTLGSLINFCDALVCGGTSRSDHSEIGSGFIHFNFTPWGENGDKATPSLVGDVTRGVFLREPRIFLGGLSGLVGPQQIGFGAFSAAGQVIRRPIPDNRMVSEPARAVDREFRVGEKDKPERRVKLNREYIGQLIALRAWYRAVRLQRIPSGAAHDHLRIVTKEAIAVLDNCIAERCKRLADYMTSHSLQPGAIEFDVRPCPVQIDAQDPYLEHTRWVKQLSENDRTTGSAWLQAIAQSIRL
jgi:acetyltransferase-like isoleucine patch superfamily enzyme